MPLGSMSFSLTGLWTFNVSYTYSKITLVCDGLSRIFDSAIPHFVVLNFKFVFCENFAIKNTVDYVFKTPNPN